MDLKEARYYGVLGCSGISRTIRKQYAPHSRQINARTPHHSVDVTQQMWCKSVSVSFLYSHIVSFSSFAYVLARSFEIFLHHKQQKVNFVLHKSKRNTVLSRQTCRLTVTTKRYKSTEHATYSLKLPPSPLPSFNSHFIGE